MPSNARIARMEAMAGRPVRTGHPGLYDVMAWACRSISVMSYLEIGVADGASLLTVLDYSPLMERLVLCDAWLPDQWHTRTSHAHIEQLLDHLKYGGIRTYLDGDSHVHLKSLRNGPPFDLILVDGGHTPEDAQADLDDSYALLRPGGILVFDDDDWTGLHEVWAGHWLKHRWKQIFKKNDGINTTVALIKPDPSNTYAAAAESVQPVAEDVEA